MKPSHFLAGVLIGMIFCKVVLLQASFNKYDAVLMAGVGLGYFGRWADVRLDAWVNTPEAKPQPARWTEER